MSKYPGRMADLKDALATLTEWEADRAHRGLTEWEAAWTKAERSALHRAMDGAALSNPVPYPVQSGMPGHQSAADRWAAIGGKI